MNILEFIKNNYFFLIVFIGLLLFTVFERSISRRANRLLFITFILTLIYLVAESLDTALSSSTAYIPRIICNITMNCMRPVTVLLFFHLVSKPKAWKVALWALPAGNSIFYAVLAFKNFDSRLANLGLTMSSGNTAIRNALYLSNLIIPAVLFLIIAVSICLNFKKIPASKIVVILFIVLICIGASIMEFLDGNVSIFGSAMCVSLVFYYLYLYAYSSKQQNKILIEQNQMDLMISQIQPHFLYNTLNSIYHLCDVNPELAKNTIDEFSTYLRSNLNSLNSSELIPFEKDLEHARTYLDIEKLRFGDRVNVEYDIRYSDFKVLPLTLQPIIENAVKHGICEKEDGGTVLIKTYLEFNDIIIQIKDDGIGFDVAKLDSSSSRHIGFNNVKNRVEKILGGRFGVQSEIGVGTTVTITLKRSGK